MIKPVSHSRGDSLIGISCMGLGHDTFLLTRGDPLGTASRRDSCGLVATKLESVVKHSSTEGIRVDILVLWVVADLGVSTDH